MEILIATVIGTAAVGAVLYPLIRPEAHRSRLAVPPGMHTPAGSSRAGTSLPGEERGSFDDVDLGSEIARYRTAVRAGTACGRCGLPNPSGSRFCAECGHPLGARSRTGTRTG